jgi:hypothetical protein
MITAAKHIRHEAFMELSGPNPGVSGRKWDQRETGPTRNTQHSRLRRSATTDGRSETIASINSRRLSLALPLRFRCCVDARHYAPANPRRNWRRVHSRYLSNADLLLARFGQCRTRDRIDVGEISRCHSQDDANLNVYSGASNGCASRMAIAVLMFRARATSRPVTGAPPADQESVAL